MTKRMEYRLQPQGVSDWQLLEEVRKAFLELGILLDSKLHKSRYKALTLTSLEETAMWATKAITHTEDDFK